MLDQYKSYLENMVNYHLDQWVNRSCPSYASNCKHQYFAFKQALDEFEHIMSVMGKNETV